MPFDGPFSRRRLINTINALRGDFESGEITGLIAAGQLLEGTAGALPQTTSVDVFDITGTIVLFGLGFRVATAIQNQANNTQFTYTPSGGSAVAICAVTSIANMAVGLRGQLASLVPSTGLNVAAAHIISPGALVLPAGSIQLSCAASNTGTVAPFALWAPFTEGAELELA